MKLTCEGCNSVLEAETGGRLVEQQQSRPPDETCAEVEAAAHTAE